MRVAGPEDEENEMVTLRERIDGESSEMNIGHAIGILGVRGTQLQNEVYSRTARPSFQGCEGLGDYEA